MCFQLFAASDTNRPFQFQKRCQYFIRVHNEPLPIAAMRISNPDCSPLGIDGWDPAQTPSGFLEIVGDDPCLG